MTRCSVPARTRPRALAAALATPVIVAALAGCGPQASPPPGTQATVSLPGDLPRPPSPGASPPTALPTRTITLSPGQSFTVRYEVSAAGTQWTQTVPGDSRLLRQASVASACPPGQTGCGESAGTTYTARAAGETSVRWSLITRGYCAHGPQPCPAATQTIHVIVQR